MDLRLCRISRNKIILDYVCINSDDCMSSDNLLCASNSMNDVKFRAKPKKSKSKKNKSKKDIWKPTGKVFTKMGYIWRPTGQTFTIIGNACPLTRITTTNEVPSRKPIDKAVATACYTQNRSMIRHRHGKTPYELLHDKPPDLSYLHVFGALCYPTNDGEKLGKLQPKADIGIFIGYAPTKKAFRIYNKRTRRIIETIHVDFDELTAVASEHNSLRPALHDMTPDLLFQPMFDESLTVDFHAPEVIAPIPEAVAPEHAVSTGSPSSTTVDQDAPSPSNSHTSQETQPPIISHDVEEDNHDIDVAHMGNDPYFGIP
ncbi:retrovirus-related pol polyprotein from transposon TNT 1-94, partial [Tanacetum coccineum]